MMKQNQITTQHDETEPNNYSTRYNRTKSRPDMMKQDQIMTRHSETNQITTRHDETESNHDPT